MPKRDDAPLGAPCWVDLFTSDPDRAQAFYGGLFGWTAEDMGETYGGYVNFSKDGRLVAGCMRNDGHSGSPDAWSVYLATDSAEGTVAAAAAAGGQTILPSMDVMHLGSMGMVADAGGAAIGIWQPGGHKGFAVYAEPGTPAWFELHTRAYDASVTFYQDVFKWDTSVMSDTPEFRYTTLGAGADALAGIMDASGYLPEGVPAHWSVYFGVTDTDAALATVVDLGGTVLEPAQDTPYGRLATAADPTGVRFKLVTAPTT
jgi:hypothetical protein